MLRRLVLLIVLANGLYFAWTQGLLSELGYAPIQRTEPQRMQQQIRPESLRLQSAPDAQRTRDETLASAPVAATATECLQSPTLDEAQTTALRARLEALPSGSWVLEPVNESARWMVYMGPYTAPDVLSKKQTELRQINVTFEVANTTPPGPGLSLGPPGPGLSLGSFASSGAANQRLDALVQRGVRTARVLQERREQRGQVLRLPLVDEALRGRLGELQVALGDKVLGPCRA